MRERERERVTLILNCRKKGSKCNAATAAKATNGRSKVSGALRARDKVVSDADADAAGATSVSFLSNCPPNIKIPLSNARWRCLRRRRRCSEAVTWRHLAAKPRIRCHRKSFGRLSPDLSPIGIGWSETDSGVIHIDRRKIHRMIKSVFYRLLID